MVEKVLSAAMKIHINMIGRTFDKFLTKNRRRMIDLFKKKGVMTASELNSELEKKGVLMNRASLHENLQKLEYYGYVSLEKKKAKSDIPKPLETHITLLQLVSSDRLPIPKKIPNHIEKIIIEKVEKLVNSF